MKKIFLYALSAIALMIGINGCQPQEQTQTAKIPEKQNRTTPPENKTGQKQLAQVTKNGTKVNAKSNLPAAGKYNHFEAEYNDIIERQKYEFDLIKDPATGKIPEGVTERSYEQGRMLPLKENVAARTTNLNTYTAAGPNNLGGRTRAFAYDTRYNGTTNRVMIAGSVSSGVMRTADGGTTWSLVAGTSNIHDITCLAQDTRVGQQDTWYLGTGEALGNSSSATGAFRLGFGVYKSTDNGLTWNRLASSNAGTYETFDNRSDLISKIIVNPVTGDVYMATIDQIVRSTDGGTSWTIVLNSTGGSSTDMTDVVCTNLGVLYAGFAGSSGNGAADGIWTSATGAGGTWIQIAGNTVPAGWKASGSYGRLVLALAPSSQNILYAFYDNKASSGAAADFFKYNAITGTWSANLSSNLPNEGGLTGNFDSQGGYDLVVAVKPDDPNFVIIGGSSAFVSTDGFATPTSFRRIGGYASPTSYSKYLNHHPDVHSFVFEPGSNIRMICGDDGGIQLTTDITATTVVWTPLNNNYQTYQYYYTAIDPTPGSTKYIGGAQDNGTTYRNAGTNAMIDVFSGDGVSVGISAGNANHYCGVQNGDFYRRDPSFPSGAGFYLKPSTETNSGLFVTLFYLNPDNTEDLYYANSTRLWRNTGASTASTSVGTSSGQWAQMTGVSGATGTSIRCFATTRGEYNPSHCLYMGMAGKILRLADPRNALATAVPANITPAGLTGGSTVIGIAVAPNNPNIVLAVISNFASISVFWTNTATFATPVWYNVEGTGVNRLDLPSFRSCAIIEKQSGVTRTLEYYVGTSAGLFSTTSIDGTSQSSADLTSWVREGASVFDQALVTSLPVRNSDNTMLVGTHGNGMYVANIGQPVVPVTWVGTTSNDWGTASNWSPARVPLATDDVVIPNGAANMPVSVTGVRTVYNINIQSSASVTVTGTLQVGSAINNSGLFTASGGTIEMNGTIPQTIPVGAFTFNTIGNLKISNPTVALLGNLSVTGSFSFGNVNNSTFQTAGLLNLRSTSSGTATVADVTNGGVNTGNTISGNVTVERYFSNKRAWRLLGIPFSTSTQTIKSAWMEGAANSASDPGNPYGTHITTFTGDGNAGNYDAVKPASSIRIYVTDNFTSDAAHTPNTTNNILNNPAYFLFVRGDRSVDRTATTVSSAATLRVTGTLNSGTLSLGVTGTSFSLIPNPYAATIDFNAVKAIGANSGINTFYVWDATMTGTNGVGQYRTVSISGSAPNYTYTATPGGANNNWRFIESGTAFFIPGSTTVSFAEATKSSSTPPSSMLRTTSNETEIAVNLYSVNNDNSRSLLDGVREVFDKTYAAGVDNYDAKKITGFDVNLGISSNNEILAVEKRPLPVANDVAALKLWNTAAGNYSFELEPANLSSSVQYVYLKDNYLNTYTPVSVSATTTINFSITGDALSAATNRFSIVFTSAAIAPGKPLITIYPNPVQNGYIRLQMNNMPKGNYVVRLVNSIGQTILTKEIFHADGTSIETVGVNKIKGTYLVEVIHPDNNKSVNKVIIN